MKQAIVARTDLGMGQGKLAAQVAHASLQAYDATDDTTAKSWKGDGAKKVVLKVDDEASLLDLAEKARAEGLPHAVVRDAGHTQLDPGTITALGIGPADETVIDRITGELSLF